MRMSASPSRILRLALALPALWLAPAPDAPAAPADPVRALFLGDRGHHRPADRFRQVEAAMRSRGVALSYTEDVGDLNSTTLARYDALLVYANIDKIEPDQARALLDYVAGGG